MIAMNILIHSPDIKLSKKSRNDIECRLLFSFSRFQDHIDIIEVHLKDINGPKGGEDKQCTIKISQLKEENITVSGKAEEIAIVIDKCITRAKSIVRRKLQMKRHHRQRLPNHDPN